MFNNDDIDNQSIVRFEQMLKTNNLLFFDSDEFENIIHHYLEVGQINLAKRAIKLALEQHPSSVNLQLFKVEIFIIENKFNQADDLLEQLHLLEPNNEEIYIQKANVLSKQDQHQEAIHTLKIATQLSNSPESDTDLYALIGMEYLFIDDFKNALIYFKKCIAIDNTDYTALHNIIYCFDFLNQPKEAIQFLNSYLDNTPYCDVAWHQLGRQYFKLNQYKKALTAFEFAIIADDTFVGAYIELGKVLEKLKRYNDAIENYKITLALEDPTSFALLRIGQCYLKLGHTKKALYFLNKTVSEDPLLDKGWIAITKFHIKEHNYTKALYYIKKAIEIDSENISYWKLFAVINAKLTFLEDAEQGYQKALNLGNYEYDIWIERCDILIKLGQYKNAITHLDKATELYPNDLELIFRLAGLYLYNNQTTKGYFYLKKGLEKDESYLYIISELFPLVMENVDHLKAINRFITS